jgi:homoserine kinase
MAFRREPVCVLVPATSANLGPAFDCAGLALDLTDALRASISDEHGVRIEIEGEGSAGLPRDASHLVARAMTVAFDAMGVRPRGFTLHCGNSIPHGRGLGSSAAAIVGGLMLARALVEDGSERFSLSDVLQWAVTMESHPDNVAAAIFGALTFAWVDEDGSAACIRLAVHPDVVPVIAVPVTKVATARARTALPRDVPLVDAAFNVARSSLLVHALSSDPSFLMEATRDRLHQGPRRAMYPESMALVEGLRDAGIPATISGAGPAVLALGSAGDLATVRSLAPHAWRVEGRAVAGQGAHEVPADLC